MGRSALVFGIGTIVLAITAQWFYSRYAPHATHVGASDEAHPYHVFNPIWAEEEVDNLFTNVVRKGKLEITTSASTRSFYDHIGEKTPTEADGSCASAFLTPNADKTHCTFPERIDVAMHQGLSGGIDARKESISTAVTRLLVMQKYYHAVEESIESIPEIAKLFKSESYMKHASTICEGRDVLAPMTLAVIISLPGQMVAMHYDLPWFFGATRYDFPGWLLVVMQTSGLFREHRVPQVQGVAYLHRWNDTDVRRGGFYFYANGTGAEPLIAPAAHNTAIICDGTEMVHGTQTYLENSEPPPVTKDGRYELHHAGDGRWQLQLEGKVLREYDEEDLRITLVWRQHCFRSEEERRRLENREVPRMKLEDVLDKLVGHLIETGRLSSRPEDPGQLMEVLVDKYVRYPFPTTSWLPYNLCALEAKLPTWTKPIFGAVCA